MCIRDSLSAAAAREVEVDDWPVVRFDPTAGQVGGSLLLIGLGLAATSLLGRLGRSEEES